MKICRFTTPELFEPQYGLIEDSVISPLIDADAFNYPLRAGASRISLSDVKLLAPVSPSKIVCVGRNYKDHAAELGNAMPAEPLLFLKAPSAIIASGEAIE